MSKNETSTHEALGGRPARSRRKAPKLRVLAVDDEPSILELLKTALTSLGSFEVAIAASGDAALKLIDRQQHPFDCLLLDIQMPQMNGIDLCKEVRRNPDYRDTPIIMVTAMSDKKYVDQAFAAGATDYVTKPFDILELRSRLGTARKLVQEHNRASDSMAVARKLKQELDTNLQFSLEDPVTIENVPRVLRHAEFENYVLQLSQGRLFNSYVTAIKVTKSKALHAQLSSSSFRDLLHDVGESLSKATKKDGNMLSYRGNGVFLCISHGRNKTIVPGAEIQLNQMIGTLLARRQLGVEVRVVIGDGIAMRSITKSGALYSLNKAIENVEAKDLNSTDVVGLSKRVLKNRSRSSEQDHLERRSYEVILQELLREEQSMMRS